MIFGPKRTFESVVSELVKGLESGEITLPDPTPAVDPVPSCHTCRYWDAIELEGDGYVTPDDIYECHRSPPSLPPSGYLAAAMADDSPDDGPFWGAWPQTRGTDWCGEWRGREG